MREMRDPGCDNDSVSPTPAQQARAAAIAAEITARLADVSFALPGTLADRMTRCGHPGCRCHADPPAAARPLPPVDPQEKRQDRHPHPDRRPARRLRPLVRQPPPPARAHRRTRGTQPRHRRGRPPLEPLARPPGRGHGHRAAEPERQPPDSVGSARLTCGQPPSQTPFAQVSPKREDLTEFMQVTDLSVTLLPVGHSLDVRCREYHAPEARE